MKKKCAGMYDDCQWLSWRVPARDTPECAIYVMPYPPSVNDYWKNFRGRVVLSGKAREFKKVAAKRLTEQLSLGDLRVVVEVFRPRKSGDLDNTLKCVLDALNGIAYKDDSQIVEIFAHRFDDKANPRVVVQIRSINREKKP